MRWIKKLLGLNTSQSDQSYRVVDLRSEEFKQMERDAAAGEAPPDEVEELLEIIREARAWGKANDWPSSEDYPQYEKIRNIGSKIDESGGVQAMQNVALHIRERDPGVIVLLSMIWSGVGEWMD